MSSNLEQQFLHFEHLEPLGRVLVGVSGGVDSVVLAHVLLKNGYEIGIAHCHFNLRGKDADEDQEFTRNLAYKLKVPFFTTKFETQTYADTRKISIQMAARNLRYFWFEKLCKEERFTQIAVGTHLTDNIETFIFNATKGTGLNGLRGIKAQNGKIIRPLLHLTKDEIYAYAKDQKLEWREDVSNQSLKYQRNKIRHEVLPVLKEINPSLESTFKRNFKRLSRLDGFVQTQVDNLWKSWVHEENHTLKIKISDISTHPFADVVFSYKLSGFGFNTSQIDDLLVVIHGQSGSVISSKDYQIYIDRNDILIQKTRFSTVPNEYSITEFLGEITNPIHLTFADLNAGDVKIKSDKTMAFFDFDSLVFPLKLRKWKAGDKLKPIGMKGSKKVSDLLIDLKIPLPEKENIWVLESNNEIIWVVGIRTSEVYKIIPETKRVYQIGLVR